MFDISGVRVSKSVPCKLAGKCDVAKAASSGQSRRSFWTWAVGNYWKMPSTNQQTVKEKNNEYLKRVCIGLAAFWKTFVVVLTPILLLPLPIFVADVKANCAYVMLIMAVYWLTECLPLPITAFLPVALYPLLNVAPVKDIARTYMTDTNFHLLGMLFAALALEEVRLHRRLGLSVLVLMGSEPRWLLLGIACVTGFMSMWMSNTSATAIMLPIAKMTLEELIRHELDLSDSDDTDKKRSPKAIMPRKVEEPKMSLESGKGKVAESKSAKEKSVRSISPSLRTAMVALQSPVDRTSGASQTDTEPLDSPPDRDQVTWGFHKIPNFHDLPAHLQGMCKVMMLNVMYGASLGGMATLPGTSTNLLFKALLQDQSREAANTINFPSWLGFALPVSIIAIFSGWAFSIVLFMGWRDLIGCKCTCKKEKTEEAKSVHAALKRRYKRLGRASFGEWAVSILFIFMIIGWVLGSPGIANGWTDWCGIGEDYTSDANIAMLATIILFVIPKRKPDFSFFKKGYTGRKPRSRNSILMWSKAQQKIPWGVLWRLGGGLAMAEGAKICGLSAWLGCIASPMIEKLPPLATVLLIVIVVAIVTEVVTNEAALVIFMPALLSVAAKAANTNPLYFALPATLSASFAFMLPIATPPNGIIYGTHMVTVKDMFMSGAFLNMVCIGCTLLSITTWAKPIFHLDEVPSWAATFNSTITDVC